MPDKEPAVIACGSSPQNGDLQVMTAEAIRYLIIISSTAALIVIAAVIYIITKARYKKEFLEKKQELQASQLKEIEQYESEISRLLEEINSSKENRELIENLVADCEKYVGEHYSGQPVVDALLAYKKKLCINSGIALEISAGHLSSTALSDEEYIGIFGNLLDNAIEAAQKTERPQVSLKSIVAKGQWILTVRNSKPAEEAPLENNMKTTKNDSSNHGLGSKIVKKIVKRHKGALDYRDYGDYFEVVSVIPVSDYSNEVQ